MRSQLPKRGETPPFSRSLDPVACQTPPAANETTAVKSAPAWLMRVIAVSQEPSMGAGVRSSALAVELMPPTARDKVANPSNRTSTVRFDLVFTKARLFEIEL